ncbi:type VII toxin-antitoxin system MntA family adenylyltransferase antitoxin [Ornithinibacillus californiensis]|uniref:type VII toxin-antitoxin system MntA family adenylyltransferase antitoxin n=1 Tax=Ornithinibacillus californiensis TaxID=161536 RepID=UPI00069FBD5B|nr:nucleotidyltransferase domain-containing protein [Ornithinibacillus californiensis]
MHKDKKQLVKDILDEHIKPIFILVFGSYAKGNANENSDLDIAYYSDRALSSYDRFLLASELSEKCHVEVDLIDIRQIDTVFAAQIFSTGELLYCNDNNLFVRERMKAYSMYATLNEQRAEILQGIKERGSIYG